MNINFEQIVEDAKKYYGVAENGMVTCELNDSGNIQFTVFISGGSFITKEFRPLKSREMNFDWIIDKIERGDKAVEERKIKSTEAVKRIRETASEMNLPLNCYVTSFGFSIDNLFQDGRKMAEELCDKLGVVYKRMEYSQAHWVVRVFI